MLSPFARAFLHESLEAYRIARDHGFHDGPINDGEKIALMHSELSEALEALRNHNPVSTTIPPFSQVEEELADAVIRIMDYAVAKRLRLGPAIEAKMAYNATRPARHGGKAF